MDSKTFEHWLAEYRRMQLPSWDELSALDLYMDQVIDEVNKYIIPLTETSITKTMINSYVKKGLVNKPIKKRYGRINIAQIIVVSLMKSAFSLDTINKGILLSRDQVEVPDNYSKFVVLFNSEVAQLEAIPSLPVDDYQIMAIRAMLYQTIVNHLVNGDDQSATDISA